MAKNIGSFGTEHEAVDLEFTYFGESIRVNPDASDLDFIAFMAKSGEIDEMDQVRAMKATMDFIQQQIHPDDWELFWATSVKNRQNSLDLLGTSKGILEAVADFPTGQSSDSSAGRQNTRQKSSGRSSSPARSGRRTGKKSDVDRAMGQLQGRPDLKVLVADAQVRRDEQEGSRAG